MRWRTIAMSAVAVLVACAMTFAQGRGPGAQGDRGDRGPRAQQGDQGPRGERRVLQGEEAGLRQTLEQLDLTDEQQQKLDELKADFDKKTADLREKARANMEELRKFREENPDDREGLQQKRRELMENTGAPLREATQGYVEQIKGVLNEEQLKQFNAAMEQRREEGGRMVAGVVGLGILGISPQAERELNLTPEQEEKVRGIAQKFAEEMKLLREKYQGLIREELTPEQQKQFDQSAREMEGRMRDRLGIGQGPQGDRGPRGLQGDRPNRRGGDRGPRREGGGPDGGDAPPPPGGDMQ